MEQKLFDLTHNQVIKGEDDGMPFYYVHKWIIYNYIPNRKNDESCTTHIFGFSYDTDNFNEFDCEPIDADDCADHLIELDNNDDDMTSTVYEFFGHSAQILKRTNIPSDVYVRFEYKYLEIAKEILPFWYEDMCNVLIACSFNLRINNRRWRFLENLNDDEPAQINMGSITKYLLIHIDDYHELVNHYNAINLTNITIEI